MPLRALLILLLFAVNSWSFAEDRALEPPEIITNPGPEYSDANRDYGMTIGIDCSPGGRLWACWVAGGDSEMGYFVVATSDDDGATWSHPRLVINPTFDQPGVKRRTLVGNLWTDPTGKLWLFFDQSLGYFDGRGGAWAITCENPDADQPVWSEPRRIWHGATLNKPTVLSDGTWMLPISLWQRSRIHATTERRFPTTPPEAIPADFEEQFHELDDERKAWYFASTDQGETWTRRGGVVFPKFAFDEHMLIELKDGRLWMLARTTEGMMEGFSSDQGTSWSEPQVRFPHTSARFHIRRLASGNLLLVKHGRIDELTRGRSHLTAMLSGDDGETWQGGLILDERGGVSYPDGFQAPDGRIYISYDRERSKEREILLAVFFEADILAGKPVSPDARLKQIISKATAKVRKPTLTSATELPKVILVGDSIRMSYQALVAKKLEGKAIVSGPKPNGQDSRNVLKNLDEWVLRQKPDVVHFNCGIHDTKKFLATGLFQVSPADYADNLRTIVSRIRKETGATVVFATSTPILDDRAAATRAGRDYALLNASIDEYNKIALDVMQELKVPINDLNGVVHTAIANNPKVEVITADGVHLTPTGQELLGSAVSEFVLGLRSIKK